MYQNELLYAHSVSTMCKKHPYRAQTSQPIPTLCTEYPFRAQKSHTGKNKKRGTVADSSFSILGVNDYS